MKTLDTHRRNKDTYIDITYRYARVFAFNVQTRQTEIYDTANHMRSAIGFNVNNFVKRAFDYREHHRRLILATYLVWYGDFEDMPEINYDNIYLLRNKQYPDIIYRSSYLTNFTQDVDPDLYRNKSKRSRFYDHVKRSMGWVPINYWEVLWYKKHPYEYFLHETFLYV